ncbi:acyltransferase [Peribacillus simplex]|uniref:acyltransferase n=1 Tax=Peribacillus simplex TaxID=1478 RepID=UPI003CFA1055
MNIKKLIKKILGKKEYIDKLKDRGLKVGENFNLYDTHIDYAFCYLVEIGDDVTITHSTILAHDASTKLSLGKSRVGKVKIGNRVFIGWGCIVLPNVKIGDDVIVAAGSVVTKDIPPNSVVAGVPARVIGETSDLIKKNKNQMEILPVFNTNWRYKTDAEIKEIKRALEDTFGYDD